MLTVTEFTLLDSSLHEMPLCISLLLIAGLSFRLDDRDISKLGAVIPLVALLARRAQGLGSGGPPC